MSSMFGLAEAIDGKHSDANGLERIAIIDWLKHQPGWSPVNCNHQHIEQLSQMMPGTGDWVLTTSQFRDWKDPKTSSSILLMYGHLGSGKSILTSLIIETIKKEVEVRSDMACVYCYPQKEDDALSPSRIWVTLLAQLLQQSPKVISEKLLSRFNESLQGSSILHPNEYWDLFSSQAERFNTVYLILDDPNSYFSNDKKMQQGFWGILENLPSNMRLLFTSRDRFRAKHLRVDHELLIAPKSEDITKYVNCRLKRDTHLSDLLENAADRELVVRQVTRLASNSNMFLLARLHMDDLSRCCTLKSIREALKRLPTNVAGAFQASFHQITKKNEQFDLDLAKHALTWIVHAKMSLSVDQILESFAIQYSKGKHYRDSRPTTERLISAVAGLVVVDTDKNIVRLVHESAKDQLQKKNILHENADLIIIKTCLACLLRATDDTGVDEQKTLLSYAANYWTSHLGPKYQDTDEEADKFIKEFLNDSTKLTRAFNLIPDTLGSGLTGMTGLHAAVYFGLCSYAESLIKSHVNINAQCVDGQTALHWAVRFRRHSLLKVLLLNSANTNIRDKENNTPLHRAIMVPGRAGIRIVQDLLNGGARPDIPGARGLTALSSTIKYGPTATAEILLESLKDVNTEISGGYNSLAELFQYDYREAILGRAANNLGQLDYAADKHVKYLINVVLNLGIDLNRPTSRDWLPLIHAVHTENPSRVRHLLERDPCPANVMQRDPTNQWSPLRWAVDYNRESDVLCLLINHGADVNEKSSDGWTPLIAAVKRNDEDKVRLLLKGGAEPDITDSINWTALLHAIDGHYKSYKNIIWLLVSNNANVCVHNNKAFDLAMKHHNHSLAWLLLEHGADPNAADDEGTTPLHRASSSDDAESVKDVRFLLHWGADAGRQDKKYSNTPLHIAVQKRLDKVVAQLAAQTKQLEIKDSRGNTALMLAILFGSKSIVRILLKNKASCTTRDPNGMTAIQYAANRGFNDALEQMVRNISSPHDVNLKDKMGYSALHHALSSDKADTQTIRILVKGGADLYAEEDKGAMTPLMLAVHLGKESFVRELLQDGASVYAQNSQGRTVIQLLKPNTRNGIRSLIENAISGPPQESSGYGRGTYVHVHQR
ncbi:ankyrin [Trichoderma evansii]